MNASAKQSAKKPDNKKEGRVVQFSNPSVPMGVRPPTGESTWSGYLFKAAAADDKANASKQGITPGQKAHPYDFKAVNRLLLANIHHARCVHTTVAATTGLGFQSEKVHEELDPLCENSWQETLADVNMDFALTGNGYLEVVREVDKIRGLHHIPAADVTVVIEDRLYNKHYLLNSTQGEGVGTVCFAKFGDLESFLNDKDRQANITSFGYALNRETDAGGNGRRVSEIIHFRNPTALSRWYGFADWLAATAAIELVQCLHQHNYDFFNNRGVPEFMLFLLGKKVSEENWKKIENAGRGHVGLGNAFKNLIVNLDDPEMVVQLEKLALEGKSDASLFAGMSDTLSLEIVSAWGVPPLLAGIQIPGKLGANNELPNALMAFQSLVIGQKQHLFETTLANTLGDRKKNGGLGLRPKDFLGSLAPDEVTGTTKKKGGLRTILETIDLGMADTVGRMKQTVPEAKAHGRDLTAGVKKEAAPDHDAPPPIV